VERWYPNVFADTNLIIEDVSEALSPLIAVLQPLVHSGIVGAGDHICYYSDLRKMRAHYPKWDITQSLEETIRQIVEAWKVRNKTA